MSDITDSLKTTPLHAVHVELGARMAGFAGYDMPIQFDGVMAEHNWTRKHAGLFDVSHMGPCFFALKDGVGGGDAAHARIAQIIERVVPGDIQGLKPGQARLSVILNEDGGILDDLIITRPEVDELQGVLYIVVNGAVKEQDFAIFEGLAPDEASLTRADDRVLVALQGPKAEEVLADYFPECRELSFMQSRRMYLGDVRCGVSRCGYTGEDGFEILIFREGGVQFVKDLLADERVKPIGLGARDSLRLEAGLCLYGNDMDTSRTPVEASLTWLIQKVRRERGDFPGAAKILNQIAEKPAEKLVGIRPKDRAPAREGTEIFIGDEKVGVITSGGFGPTVGGPVAMGYVATPHAKAGTEITLMVRGKPRAAEIAKLPFVPHNYKR